MRKALVDFFDEINQKFIKDKDNKIDFYQTLQTFVEKSSKARVIHP